MRSKDRVLALLSEAGDDYLSGAEIAGVLGISRSAVWKAIEALRREGFLIEASTNRGYCLADHPDPLSRDAILAEMAREAAQRELAAPRLPSVEIHASIASTSRRAKELALQGAPHGAVVLADSQTEGSGHYARSFYSPPGGIYLSVILRPEAYPHTKPRLVTSLAAVSAAEAIEDVCGLHPEIKPVNDLYLEGRKICGILTESVSDFESGEVQWIVVGIGINFRMRLHDLPEEIREKAGALYPEGKPPVSRNTLIAAVLMQLLERGPGRSRDEILRSYEQRICKGFDVFSPEDML